MRMNLSNNFKPAKRRRSVAHVVNGTNSYLIIGEYAKIPIRKRLPYDTLSIDAKFLDIADFGSWKQQGRKFGVNLLKRNFRNVNNGQIDSAALTIRKRRRSIRQQRQQQQVWRLLNLQKQSQCQLDLVDSDQISQWSVPLAISGTVMDDDQQESDLFATHSHSLPLVRSHSQQNFRGCDETEIYCYETTPIDLEAADCSRLDYQGNLSNVEPHLNYYVENCRDVKIQDGLMNDGCRGEYEHENCEEDVHDHDTTLNHIKDEDNLFDNLCHSGCVCSDNAQNSDSQQDLSRCAEMQKTEINAKAFLVYVDYYATKCDVKIQTGNDISAQARDKWQSLTQKEKLPFLLQAYISDYMPNN